MKSIQTLVADIYRLIQEPPDELPKDAVEDFGRSLAGLIARRLTRSDRKSNTLRASNLGEPCLRKLWYSVNRPELAEPLSAPTRIKFLFGDILECLLLFLAKCAGHTVADEQAEIDINGVKGHIDGTIDSELVDCKSASTLSFAKFAVPRGLISSDPFGYLVQLGAYGSRVGSGSNDHFLAIDKQHGHIALATYPKDRRDFAAVVADRRAILQGGLPERGFTDEPHQKSGNRKLCTPCSYCAFKYHCWPNLRVAYYSGKPVFLTVVRREPRVRTSDGQGLFGDPESGGTTDNSPEVI